MEHFGITTVEAMSGKCVPVVINKGGQTEIVENGKNGFLWNDIDELLRYTLDLIGDEDLMRKMGEEALIKSKKFSKESFAGKVRELLTRNE